MSTPEPSVVTFIQNDLPALKSGIYKIVVSHSTNQPASTTNPGDLRYDKFEETREFAVVGERFALGDDEVVSVFPPVLATGEYTGVLPHVILRSTTLPWQREAVTGRAGASWLALLTFAASELPANAPGNPKARNGKAPVPAATAKDLVPHGRTVAVAGSTVTGIGTMPDGTVSYPMPDSAKGPDSWLLDYGESPEDPCTVIDIPVADFNRIAPCADDLEWIAHVREVDTAGGDDHPASTLKVAVVVGNRLGSTTEDTYAFLVSLENFGDYLPGADGHGADALKDAQCVRLLVLRSWHYTGTGGAAGFLGLVENLNKTGGVAQPTTLRLPVPLPDPAAVAAAMARQAAGQLTDGDASTLAANAFALGYVPLDHQLRHTGNLVSWYRGPLVPYPVDTFVALPQGSADAMARYNPQTGMFDMSYAAAWQLGQLMALQSTGYSTTLYAWKKHLQKAQAAVDELDLIAAALPHVPDDQDVDAAETAGPAHPFASLLAVRRMHAQATLDNIPDAIVAYILKLRVLEGVPFAYLIPDESMLPPESLRFFYLDPNWVDALIDGAFSIGRATEDDLKADATLMRRLEGPVRRAARQLRGKQRPAVLAANASGRITGFLLRSAVLKGWRHLQVNGYDDANGQHEIHKFRQVRLSDEVLLVLFDGELKVAAIHESPGELHFGVEGAAPSYTTTLRSLASVTIGTPPVTLNPGEQIPAEHKLPFEAPVPSRGQGPTLQMAAARDQIVKTLADHALQQGNSGAFTSAEFALQMIKGVARVEFRLSDQGL
jgi:hypothetical protein